MMQLDFDTKVDRTGMASIRELTTPKSISEAGLISFWGAEFEFKMPDFIIEAIKKWLDQGLIAYCLEDMEYLLLVKNWMKLHRNWEIETQWIVPTYGLTHSVGTICRAFTKPGDGIIGMGPVYHMTWNPVILNDRKHVDCPLIFDNNVYSIDYDLLENLMSDPKNKILTLCNPHNPIGKVWGRKDLEKISELALRYDTIIYSDEIFADTVYEGVEMLTFSQITGKKVKWIVATSIGKTFSITGIGQANIIISDQQLREEFVLQRDKDHYGSFNPMMRAAYFGGYTQQGHIWVLEMMQYCYRNYLYTEKFCKEYISEMIPVKPEGGFCLWLDCRLLGFYAEQDYQNFFEKAGFICDSGATYGNKPGFIRVNLAAPKKELQKVLELLEKAVKKWRQL